MEAEQLPMSRLQKIKAKLAELWKGKESEITLEFL